MGRFDLSPWTGPDCTSPLQDLALSSAPGQPPSSGTWVAGIARLDKNLSLTQIYDRSFIGIVSTTRRREIQTVLQVMLRGVSRLACSAERQT